MCLRWASSVRFATSKSMDTSTAATGQPVSVLKSVQRNSAFVKKTPSGEWQTLIRATSQLQSHRTGTKAAVKCLGPNRNVTYSTHSCCLPHCAAAWMFCSSLGQQHQLVVGLSAFGVGRMFCFIACHQQVARPVSSLVRYTVDIALYAC